MATRVETLSETVGQCPDENPGSRVVLASALNWPDGRVELNCSMDQNVG